MNIDIQKITKTILRKNKGLQDPQLIYPARDWAIGMIGTLVIVFGAVGFSVWQYQSYTNLSLDQEVVLAMVPYKTAQVEEALVRYRALTAIHNEIISATTSTSVIDREEEIGNEESESESKSEDGVVPDEVSSNSIAPTDTPDLAF